MLIWEIKKDYVGNFKYLKRFFFRILCPVGIEKMECYGINVQQ